MDSDHKDLELEQLNEYLYDLYEYRYVDESAENEGIAINIENTDSWDRNCCMYKYFEMI